ncbi:formate dehydrogenase [Streptomyces griseorubiginosus]|uniref:Formate dehydrogenase n=1 Tax=Streptomyces griseorubiginosus TaxID=67304 RepID=A0A117P0S3_9ACTN|nr:formate dehydrogenase [Streptomyces griseorubiginosus]KUN67121.1 formate dehydrogenase [Streptomyces griseorubiginosus]
MTELSTHVHGSGSWARPNIGTAVPMAHAIGRDIIQTGLAEREFIERATSGYEEYRSLVEPWTLSLAVKVTGVPATSIRELARTWAYGEPGLPSGIAEYDGDAVRAWHNLELLVGRGQGGRDGRVPFHIVEHPPPVDLTDERYPLRLTKGCRLDPHNPRFQKGGSTSPLRRAECVELSPEDAERYGVVVGEEVRVVTRRGATTAPVWVDPALRPGLAFMTESSNDADGNEHVARARCPIAGAAEFEAAAIRIEKSPTAPVRIETSPATALRS